MKAIAVSFSVAVLFGTALTGATWAQTDDDMMELPPLPGETAPASPPSPPAPPAPMDPAMEMDSDMEFPPLPEDAVVGNEEPPAPSESALSPLPGETMEAPAADAEMAQPQDVEPLQPLDLSEEPASAAPMEANVDVGMDANMEAEMAAPTSPAAPSAPAAAVPAPPAPPAPAAPTAAQGAPQENDDFFSDLFGEEGQEAEQAASEPEEVSEPDVVEEMEEPVQQVRPAPRLRREAKDYRLPSKIYKKEYDTDNRHLPVARYEQEYDQQLFLAAAHDRVDVIRGFLDQQGRLPSMRNEVGDTVLLYAVRNGSQNTVRMLLGRVIGTVWATRKDEKLEGLRFLIVQEVDLSLAPKSAFVIAVDSVPAIFAITTDPYIVYTSNIFAILGLRTLYFALAALLHRFRYLKPALALVLVVIGSKIFVNDFVGKVPPEVSLVLTLAILGGGVAFSLIKTRREETPHPAD